MSDNRELLELAAKAAGYVVEFIGEDAFRNGQMGYWNPFEDDGDAFRLMVELEMSVEVYSTGIVVKNRYGYPTQICLSHPDPHVATRRAIVQAAAEIGRQMNS